MYVDISVLRCLKENLVLAIDAQFQTASNIMLLKTVIPLKTKEQSHFKFKTILYALLCYVCGLSNVFSLLHNYEDACLPFKQEAA